MEIKIVENRKSAMIYLDSHGNDYDGLILVSQSFAKDINMITDITPVVTTDLSSLYGMVIIAGSIGNNLLIDKLIEENKIDVSSIKDKWECYKICLVEKPYETIDKALIVVGSDKRGTIYGIYHISSLIGVSPWVYWGDVTPQKRSLLTIPQSQLDFTSKEPSVRYRGFFLNDEWPSLGTWVTNKFEDFNEDFYQKVFELILRLKGNFMWPAMWSAVFSENGKRDNIANLKLAHAYGIVMGTSHHEPMFRAGEEWQKTYQNYGSSDQWDYCANGDAITSFWEDGVIRNKDYESYITLGMRGERDSSLGGGLKENIDLLKSIITTQKALLNKHGLSQAPKVLTLYKEVEQFWYGSDTVEGLKDWDVLNDVTIMLSEDNFGNVRTLPTPQEKDRASGWGLYYHFDYHGGPTSYEWVNTVPLEKVWEQMSMAFDYGIRHIWIVNVGDLKPMEFPLSYFLDLAYDFDTWGTDGINKTMEYTNQWVMQQFGSVVPKTELEGIANLLSDYTRMNGKRKPEIITPETFSNVNFNEGERVLAKADQIQNTAERYYEMMPEGFKDTFYQLVYYPAVASANVVKMHIYAGLNIKYSKCKSMLANKYAKLMEETILRDEKMQSYYNDTMSGGKWQGIMSSPHIGYINWNADGWKYPKASPVNPIEGALMIVTLDGVQDSCTSGDTTLPIFSNLEKQSFNITISNGGNKEFNYNVETREPWISVDSKEGIIGDGKTVKIGIDWHKIKASSRSMITIIGAGKSVNVNIIAKIIDKSDFSNMTFASGNNIISIEGEHTCSRVEKSGVQWKTIINYGRSLSSLKMFPTTVSFENVQDAPCLEYKIYFDEAGEYTLTTYTSPTNNLSNSSRLRYAVSFNEETPIIVDSLPADFVAGDYDNEQWCKGVSDNIHLSTSTHQLSKGTHILRFYGIDAGLVLQKLVLSKDPLPYSYFGPQESYYKK